MACSKRVVDSALVPTLGDVTSKLWWYRGFAVIFVAYAFSTPEALAT